MSGGLVIDLSPQGPSPVSVVVQALGRCNVKQVPVPAVLSIVSSLRAVSIKTGTVKTAAIDAAPRDPVQDHRVRLVLRIKPQCRLAVTGANDPVASRLTFMAK